MMGDNRRLRQRLLTLMGLLLTAAVTWHASQLEPLGFSVLHELERDAYDLRMRLTADDELDPRVVIVDIDEESLRRVGQWPWPRAIIGRLVDQLFDRYRIDTLGFDVVFAEPETVYPLETIERVILNSNTKLSREGLRQGLLEQGGDLSLARSLAGRSVVLGYFFETAESAASIGALPGPLFSDEETVSETNAPTVRRYSANLEPLQEVAGTAGFFSLSNVTDTDGVIRRVALLNKYEGALYAALPLMMTQRFFGFPPTAVLAPVEAESSYLSLEALDIGMGRVPLDAEAAVFVPYRQPHDSYRYIPAWQVLEGKEGLVDDLSGTLVLVGTSASGLVDLRNTPLQNAFPGVEIHATLLSGLLDGSFRSQPEWTRALDVLLILVIGTLLSFALPRLSAAIASLLVLLLLVAAVAGNLYAWHQASWVLPIASLLSLMVLQYLLNMIVGLFAETRSRINMQRTFGLYVPPEIVDEMSASPDIYALKSEKRDMTVLFSDVRDFTSLSENLSPDELSALLNTLLTPVTEIIHRHRGAIDKYMGDAVMAFWGAPVADRAHASRAVAAALEMVDRLHEVNAEFEARGWPRIRMGIGLSTGPMSVGNMGSKFRMAYTVLGDTVNLGSRLEALTKLYGVDIVVSEHTRLSAPEYVYQELDQVRVKGKLQPERIYAPLAGSMTPALEQELDAHTRALSLYRDRDWAEAKAAFEPLAQRYQRELYRLYLDRISRFESDDPGADWDGVFNLTQK